MEDYSAIALDAHNTLIMAMAAAKLLLPRTVTQQHWQKTAAGAVGSWRDVESWYRNQDDCNRDILGIVTHMALMSDALASLASVTTRETTTGSYKVAKQRRHQ